MPNASGDNTLSTLAGAKKLLPTIERYTSHYLRYNGPIGRAGENKTTHTAEVKFPAGPTMAVVKVFPLRDKGWVNEALAWCLGTELDVGMPPRAMLLAASPSDLYEATDPELVLARTLWTGSGPVMLWCASKLEIKPPQHVWGRRWELAVMSKPHGHKLAAFDSWLGNCDRLDQNAPYWMAKGRVAALDHEKLAFNQDWVLHMPSHMDRLGMCATHLMKEIRAAVGKKKIKSVDAKYLISELVVLSDGHADALEGVRDETEQLISANFGASAAKNLLGFLSERTTPDFVNERLEQLR